MFDHQRSMSPKNYRGFLKKRQESFTLLTSNVGTSTYLSPELEKPGNVSYNEKVDIYALGLILCEMYSSFKTHHERMMTLTDLKKGLKVP